MFIFRIILKLKQMAITGAYYISQPLLLASHVTKQYTPKRTRHCYILNKGMEVHFTDMLTPSKHSVFESSPDSEDTAEF